MTPSEVVLVKSIASQVMRGVAKNSEFKSFLNDFTSATVNWFRGLFLIDDDIENPNDLGKMIISEPEDDDALSMLVSAIKLNVKNDATKLNSLKEIEDKLSAQGLSSSDSKVSQIHYGSGDNIGRDKNVNTK